MRLALLLISQVVMLDVPDPQSQGRVALRLLDEGYDVAASKSVTKDRLHLRQTAGGYEVRWRGQAETVQARTPAVSEVAAIQKVLITLPPAPDGPSLSKQRIRLAWLAGMSAHTRAQWVHRLLSQGRTLTLNDGASRGLCLVDRAQARPGPVNQPCEVPRAVEAPTEAPTQVPDAVARDTVTAAQPQVPPPLTMPGGAALGASPVSVRQARGEAVSSGPRPGAQARASREVDARATRTATPTPTLPSAEPELLPGGAPKSESPIEVSSAPAPRRAAHRLRLQAAVGLTPHSDGLDPTVAVQGSAWWSWFGLRLAGLGVFASAAELSVFEAVLSAGPALRWSPHPDWQLGAALLAGARLHRWQLDAAGGLRTDFAVDLPLSAHWRPADPLYVGLIVRPAVHSRARRHTLGDALLWQRGVFRFSVLLSVGVGVF